MSSSASNQGSEWLDFENVNSGFINFDMSDNYNFSNTNYMERDTIEASHFMSMRHDDESIINESMKFPPQGSGESLH